MVNAMKAQNNDTTKHAHDRARARGWEAALTGAPNPYAHGTQCAILFDLAKEKGQVRSKEIAEEVRKKSL